MDIVQVYVVAGPSIVYFGGRNVPGGFEYLSRNLSLLAALNGNVNFEVNIAHSVYHGSLYDFKQYPNMIVRIYEFDGEQISGLKELDPVVQHGTLLNELFRKSPPHSRYVLILDPDCFAIEEKFVSSCIQKMRDTGVAIMGVPYPAWYPKEYSLRTPQLYFCLFDRNEIEVEKIDLRAGNSLNKSLGNLKLPRRLMLSATRRLRAELLANGVIKVDGLTETLLNSKSSLIQKRFEINPLDTGWRVGALLDSEDISFETFPNILKTELGIPGFNRKEYLKVNVDLSHISGHIGWHLLAHGLIEDRRLGRQGLLPKFLKSFMRSKVADLTKWPASSFLGRELVSNPSDLSLLLNAIPAADCYSFNGKFSIFHLGSKGKGHLQNELEILDHVLSKFVRKRHQRGTLKLKEGTNDA